MLKLWPFISVVSCVLLEWFLLLIWEKTALSPCIMMMMMCAHMLSRYVCKSACMYMCSLSWWWVSSLVTPHLIDHGRFCWTWSLVILASLACQLVPATSCLCIPSAEITGSCHAYPEFTWVLSVWIPVLMLVWQVLCTESSFQPCVVTFLMRSVWRKACIDYFYFSYSFKFETNCVQTWSNPAALTSWVQRL